MPVRREDSSTEIWSGLDFAVMSSTSRLPTPPCRCCDVRTTSVRGADGSSESEVGDHRQQDCHHHGLHRIELVELLDLIDHIHADPEQDHPCDRSQRRPSGVGSFRLSPEMRRPATTACDPRAHRGHRPGRRRARHRRLQVEAERHRAVQAIDDVGQNRRCTSSDRSYQAAPSARSMMTSATASQVVAVARGEGALALMAGASRASRNGSRDGWSRCRSLRRAALQGDSGGSSSARRGASRP